MAKYLEERTQNAWVRKWELEITEEGTFFGDKEFFFKNRIYRFYADKIPIFAPFLTFYSLLWWYV